MGLSAREIALTINARDNASPVINKVNSAIGATGLAGNNASLKMFGYSHIFSQASKVLTGFGLAVGGAAVASAKMAISFDKDMALVQTQARLSAEEFDAVKKSVLDMSSKSEHGVKTLSEGLYDIFSSMTVNATEAIHMLEAFSKAATAGGTDVRTVARSAISMLNAFGMEAKDVNKVLDAQFKFVQMGVGTYEEFASVLGMLSPSAVAAGQNINTMVGALAFATRNGLSASEAVTSVGRAMDLISRPTVRKNLKDALGIDVVDEATGKYRDITDILGDMAREMDGMKAPERKEVFKEIFGQGEIRAMRFFNLAIPRFKDLKALMEETSGPKAAGAFLQAFDTMSKTPAVRLATIANSIKAMAIETATSFIPAVEKAAQSVEKFLGWLKQLSPATKQTIATWLLWSGAISLVLGRILGFASQLTMTISIMRLANLSMTEVITRSALMAAKFAILVGAIALVTKSFSDNASAGMQLAGMATVVVGVFLGVRKLMPLLVKAWEAFKFAIFAVKYALMILRTEGMAGLASSFGSMLTKINPVTIALTLLAAAFALNAMQEMKVKQATDAFTQSLLAGTTSLATYQNLISMAGSSITGFTSSVSILVNGFKQATAAVQDKMAALRADGVVIGEHTNALIKSRMAVGDFHGAMKTVEVVAEAHQAALTIAGGALTQFQGKAQVGAGEVRKAFADQRKAVEEWASNFQAVIARNIPKDLQTQLFDMGLQGAGIVEALATANNKKFRKIIEDWQAAQGKSKELGEKVKGLGDKVKDLPDKHPISITANTSDAVQKINALLALLRRIGYHGGGSPQGTGSGAGGNTGKTGPLHTGGIPRFHGGGVGPPKDIFAVLQQGEMVTDRRTTKKLVDMVNNPNRAASLTGGSGIGEMHIHVHGSNVADPKAIADELDWEWRTRGF